MDEDYRNMSKYQIPKPNSKNSNSSSQMKGAI